MKMHIYLNSGSFVFDPLFVLHLLPTIMKQPLFSPMGIYDYKGKCSGELQLLLKRHLEIDVGSIIGKIIISVK